MNPAYRIPDNALRLRRAGHGAEGDRPIARFNVRSFITSLADGAKLKPGATTYAASPSMAATASRGRVFERRRQKLGAAKLGHDLGKYSFREWTLPFNTTWRHELKVRATNIRRVAAARAVLESGRLHAQRRRNRSRHGGMRGTDHGDTGFSLPLSLRQASASPPPTQPRSATNFPKGGDLSLQAGRGSRGGAGQVPPPVTPPITSRPNRAAKNSRRISGPPKSPR